MGHVSQGCYQTEAVQLKTTVNSSCGDITFRLLLYGTLDNPCRLCLGMLTDKEQSSDHKLSNSLCLCTMEKETKCKTGFTIRKHEILERPPQYRKASF